MAVRRLRGSRLILATLILLLLLFPVLEDMARPILLIAVIASIFATSVSVISPDRRHMQTAVTLAVVQVVLTAVAVALSEHSLAYRVAVSLGIATTILLIVYSIYCILRYVLQATVITRDQIYAGICAYLMLGFAFGCLYYLLNILDPGCFGVNTAKPVGKGPDLMYFSFVTLTTLGYGDITPVAKAARALVELEAVAGMLYMAIFMARLVSLHSGRDESSSAKDVPGSAWRQSNGRDAV